MISAFIAGQLYLVLFIAIHDWVSLGSLNHLAGIRAVDSTGKLLVTTILSTLPFAVGLLGTIYYASAGFPAWLWWTLWISYGAGCYGMLRAWWLPYLVIEDPVRAARYRARFAHTHAFLPERNGIRPDTLHVTFHAVLVTTTILLVLLSLHHVRRAAAAQTGGIAIVAATRRASWELPIPRIMSAVRGRRRPPYLRAGC